MHHLKAVFHKMLELEKKTLLQNIVEKHTLIA